MRTSVLNVLPKGTIVYLSNEDFEKVKLYQLESISGTLLDELRNYALTEKVYGYLTVEQKESRRRYVEKWALAYRLQKAMCVNTLTGEVFEPDDTNYGEWISL